MSIASKQSFLRDIENSLGSIVTVDNLTEIMKIISEQMSLYDVEQTEDIISDAESSDLLDIYLDAKRIEGRSEKTIERYRYLIQRMYDCVNVPIRKISVFHLRKYFSDEKERGISDRTIDGIRQVLSAYFGWLQKEGLLEKNPISNIGAIKCVKKVRKPFTPSEIESMKEACENNRDKAIIALLLSTGCRISEVCALNRDSVDFSKMEILVLGKGNKERTVYIDDITSMLLKRYFSSRADDHSALFIGKGTERFKPGGIRRMLKVVEEKSGVENIHPHRFRRTLATNLIHHGMPIQEVASILGHDKLDTTMKYVYIDNVDVKHSYRKYA